LERILSPDERIRRVEEIYYQRRNQGMPRDATRVNISEKKNYYPLKKMALQVAICIVLYGSLYLIQTTNYSFSAQVLGKAKEILEYDMNFSNIYGSLKGYINNLILVPRSEEKPVEGEENKMDENEKLNEEIPEEVLPESEGELTEEGQGGEEGEVHDEERYLTKMEADAEYVKENYLIQIPLRGTITSRYGNRTPIPPVVSAYHTGIDIAVNTGTVFVSAMSGTVEIVSSERRIWEAPKDSRWRCVYPICSLQFYLCERRRCCAKRTRNRKNWSYRECYRAAFAF